MNNKQINNTKSLDIDNGLIDLSHGSGGKAMVQLINDIFVKSFDNDFLKQGNDQAAFLLEQGRWVMSTDAHVVTPLFFPGSDIGKLSVFGTINDIAMSGAKPVYLSASFIIEEGFSLQTLQKIVFSMAQACQEANVLIVTGDTKIVEKGKADGVFISTTGIGVIENNKINISSNRAKAQDKIIINGFVGDHGIAVMSQRENLTFATSIESDCSPLHDLVSSMVQAVPGIHCMRDVTRGGLSASLNELANSSNVGMIIDEGMVPIRNEVNAACELLGLDPFYVANEGKLIAICSSEEADLLLHTMQKHELGKHSAIIGEVIEDKDNFIQIKTILGGKRILNWLSGEQLPRIC